MTNKKLEEKIVELEQEFNKLQKQVLELALRQNTTWVYPPQPYQPYVAPQPLYEPFITCGVQTTLSNLEQKFNIM